MATFDVHPNFAYSTVATAPSPATSGTSVVVASGDGALFATTPPFNAVLWPAGVQPTSANAEIVRVTARSTDTLTITRAQEGTTGKTVLVGWQIAAALTQKTLTDHETAINAHTHVSGDGGVLTYTGLPAGAIVQAVSTTSGAVASGTTLIPQDDTIPQNTEGDEYMTRAITPKATTHRLIITWGCYLSSTVVTHLIAALFQDSTADSLAVGVQFGTTATGMQYVTGSYEMAAGTTSATTFKIRCGGSNAGTLTFNGVSGARRFGTITKSWIHILEVKA